MPLQRYRELIADWDAFAAAHHTPEPVTFRLRRALSDPATLLARLSDQGFDIRPVPSVPGYYRVEDGPDSVAQTLEHWLGHLHVQQAVMGLPSLALDPSPGERVLDLCAAPGGKTLHLAELMEEEGPLVAVDPKEKRLRGLLGNVYRLGVSNVLVIASDGRDLPGGALFDRVLVDAPCSGEGNYRRQGRLPARDREFTSYATALQEALLRRAIDLTRPGGTLVYSTCTYAPEENEAVVDRVLADAPVEVLPIDLDAPHAPGVTSWAGTELRPELRLAWRVYPHHLDSGGLFMVRLRRSGETPPSGPDDGWRSVPRAFPGEEATPAEERLDRAKIELEDRFGYRREWIGQRDWMVRGSHIWVHGAREWPVERWHARQPGKSWRVVSLGLRALREAPGNRETPSSHFLSRWPRDIAPERRVEFSAESLRRLLEGNPLEAGDLPTGPVALQWQGMVLGRGMVGRAGLKHELGRSYAERLLRIIDS